MAVAFIALGELRSWWFSPSSRRLARRRESVDVGLEGSLALRLEVKV
jgi:hypothetical protein